MINSWPLFCSLLFPSTVRYAIAYLCALRQRAAAADGKVVWYVQPGGRDMRNYWNEGGRVVWKVPAECLFPKVGI